MFTVTITQKGGNVTVRDFDQPEVTIGRIQGNDIVLAKSNISKRHARIVYNDGKFVVIDSKSTNGTYINGKRIDAPYDMRVGDKIFIGDFAMEVDGAEARTPSKTASPPPPEPVVAEAEQRGRDDLLSDDEWGAGGELADDWADDWNDEPADGSSTKAERPAREGAIAANEEAPAARPARRAGPAPAPPADDPRGVENELAAPPKAPGKAATRGPGDRAAGRPVPPAPSAPPAISREQAQALIAVHERLLRSLDLRRLGVERMQDDELRDRTRAAVEDIVTAMAESGELDASVEPNELINRVLDEALGLGPLEDLLADDSITEIMVNSATQIYVERGGRLEQTDRTFSSDQAVLGVIERIVAPIGRRIDESSPMVDARLKDGSRVNAIIAPLALKGPSLTIRKFTREPLEVDDLVAFGTLTPEMAEFLETCVSARKNILISGGTGSGKTTTLNVLSGYIPDTERILTIEDAAELKLGQEHVVSLEARPPNIEGRGAVTIRDLVRNALRMRPDRIVVGECRGGEALDMLQAMNTGHEGSLTTVHANGPRDALSRLETMVLMSGMELPIRAIRDQIASAIDIVVQQARLADGSRRVTHISEITGMESEVISMQDIFIFEQRGFDAQGRVAGSHKATGFVPKFYEELKARGIATNFSIFQV